MSPSTYGERPWLSDRPSRSLAENPHFNGCHVELKTTSTMKDPRESGTLLLVRADSTELDRFRGQTQYKAALHIHVNLMYRIAVLLF